MQGQWPSGLGGVDTNISDLIEGSIRDILSPRRSKQFYEKLAKPEGCIKMGLNENMLVDRSFSGTILQEAAGRTDVRLYPAVKGGDALKSIAEDLGVWEDQVLVGNGSDEIIDLVAKVFITGGEAIVVDPTFEMYRFSAEVARGTVRSVLISEDFMMKASEVLSAVTDKTRVIFICSPNNPTGKQYSKDEVLRVVEESDRLVVLDEAYADFAPYSLTQESVKYNNLLVLRTFSKSFGLAGLRIGYAVADNEIVEWLRAAQAPFSVNAMAQEACKLVLENRRVYDSFVKKVLEERRYLMAELQMVNGIQAYESDSNFILFRVLGGMTSDEVCRVLGGAGLEIRNRGDLPMLKNCVRVTVSDRDSNLKFIKELKNVLGSSA